MSFPRAPIRRFNDPPPNGCAPPPGSYDPKFTTDVGAITRRSVITDKCARFPAFRRQDSGAVTPTLPEPETAGAFGRRTFRRSSSSSPYTNSCRRGSSASVSEQSSATASRCNSYTSIFMRRPKTASATNESVYSTPSRNGSATKLATQIANKDLVSQFNRERENWLEKEHHMQQKIESLRDQLNGMEIKPKKKQEGKVTKSVDEDVLDSSVNILKITIDELQTENQKLKENIEVQEKSKDELETRVMDLSDQNSSFENSTKEHDDQLNIMKTIVESLEEANSQQVSKLDMLEKDNIFLVSKLEEAEAALGNYSKERNEWARKEKVYQDKNSALEKILENNHAALLESDERVSVLVTEVENHYQVGREKISEMEKIRSTWEFMEADYNKCIDNLRSELEEKNGALEEERGKVADLLEERDKISFSVHENSYNLEDMKNDWDDKETYYKDTIEELNAKCKDLHISTLLYKSKLLTMHNTWKTIMPIKQQLLEFKTELSNLLTNKQQADSNLQEESGEKTISSAGDKNLAGDEEAATKPIVQLVAEIEQENFSLRQSISFMQGAIADILGDDETTVDSSSNEPLDINGNPFLSEPKDSAAYVLTLKTSIDDMLEGSNAIKKALTENIKKKVSHLGLNIVLDDGLEGNNTFDSGDMPKNIF